MTNTKQDNVGFCLRVTPSEVVILKLALDDVVMSTEEGRYQLTRSLVNYYQDGGIWEPTLDVSCEHFSDETINIFSDDESILKNHPLTAVTRQGLQLHGNLVLFGSNDDGDSVLLNASQVGIILSELKFSNNQVVKPVDLTESISAFYDNRNSPNHLQQLIQLLSEYCFVTKTQVLIKTVPVADNRDDAVLVMSLYGTNKQIDYLAEHINYLIAMSGIEQCDTN